MKKFNIIAILSATALLSSCGLYNKYERPEVQTDGIMRDAAQYATVSEETSFGDVDWHEVFTDPQLQALIEQGLEKNVDLLNAIEDVKMAKAQLQSARLAFLPSFTFSPNGTLSKVYDMGADMSKTYSFPVTASWNADIWGSLASANRSSKAAYLQSQDYQQSVRSSIITGIATTYYSLLLLDRQLEILLDMQTLTKDNWNMTKLQKDLGTTRETAVVAAESNHLSVQSQIIDMKRQISAAENSLSLLVGQAAQSIQRGKLENQNLPSSFSIGIADSLLANRPDVHAAELSLAQCFYSVQQAKAAFYPGLTFTVNGAYSNSVGSAVINPGKFLLSAVGQLTQPIFQNGKLVANLKVTKAQYEQAYNTWQYTLLKAGSEVSDALVLYNSSDEKSKIDQRNVEVLQKSVSYTRDLYKMGSSTYLEILTAQQNLLNAEITQATDDYNKMSAVVSLYSALGGGRK